MTERLFQFIWQFQYFNNNELQATTGESIQIIFPGRYNTNQGPDFTDARIRIGATGWAGTIELHLKTSDWKRHRHHQDNHYRNVILHVVWENDLVHSDIPVLELKDRISGLLCQRYELLMNNAAFIPCDKSIASAPAMIWKDWKETLLIERLERKSMLIETYLAQNNSHWEETFWWLIARNFGTTVNADAFESLARSVSVNILAKQKQDIRHVEALLFGQAGLLKADFAEDYPRLLQKEYRFLKHKYSLPAIHLPLLFLRMRPGNFPTVRLAQLAMLVHQSAHLFSRAREAASLQEVRDWLDITAADYWDVHYRFDETSVLKKKRLGQAMTDSILINTIIPVLFTYGLHHKENKYREKALHWLGGIAAESNTIMAGYRSLGIDILNAKDSQALIELKNEYCNKRRCLECAVGNGLLKQE